ncbi:MAG: hypothetical protein KatS3mg019_0407 [Fimbriimonadales bacterium]|nr:MAG: hypothetical protein KatS3mg019_0407 [Fimbriimonadales bacterium]
MGYNLCMRCLWIACMLAMLSPSLAQEVKTESKPAETTPVESSIPPHYSLKQLKQWIDQQKQRAKARVEALERSGVSLEPQHRHKLEEGPEYLEALWDYLYVRAYPNDFVDWNAYLRAAEQRELMTAAFYPAAGSTWQFVGPSNASPPYRTYFGTSAISGRVNAVAYDPINENTYYIGAPQGGVWKTTNGGQMWQPLTDNWQFLQVACIAIHPTNPNIIYVGTGDFQGWMRPFSQGVMRSADGGQTWQSLGATQFGNRCVSDILIDPENPNIITVCTGWGPYQGVAGALWRSTDGGDTWTQVSTVSAIWSDLAIGARNPTTGLRYYYAVGHGNPGRLLRSSDRGQTWTTLTPPFSGGSQSSLRVATSPNNPDRVYLMSGVDSQVWVSNNAGNNWTPMNPTEDGGFYQAWYDATLHVSSDGSGNDVLYLGLVDLVQWTQAYGWRSIGRGFTNQADIHVDQHSMAVNPRNPNELLIGNDGGVYRLIYTPTTGTVNITGLNATLGITQIYWAAFHPTDLNRMMGGAQDNATPRANGNLNNWQCIVGGDGAYCAYNPNNPSIQYASSQYLNIRRTNNNWGSSQTITPNYGSDRVAFIAPLAVHPAQPNWMLAGTNFLYRWNETTQSWTSRLGNQSLTNGRLRAIAGAPSNANVIYTGGDDGQVWMTNDAGNTWRQINTGLPNRSISDIAVHPSNPYKVYVVLGGTGTPHAYRCDNTQASSPQWVNISGSGITGLPDVHTNTIALDFEAPDLIFYVGNDVGFFYTLDGGATWRNGTQPFGLPNVQVNTVRVLPATGYLMAATYGRGIWRLQLPLTHAGDANGDGCVDDSDLLIVLIHFGSSNPQADLNRDGIVNDSDLLQVLFNFGSGC